MATSPEEQTDLAALHEAQHKEREMCLWMCRDFLRCNEQDLKARGHKTQEAAIVYTVKASLKRLDALVKAHIKKWPD